jgi:tetratricopeptide (TPR) repeat protein
VANHHISPGKKQWTWGNHEFGYAWDRNLTDSDGPYIEIMAGVFTDNQPDFSFLAPGETRTWSQFWYPIREIGPALEASVEAALSLRVEHGRAAIGVHVTERIPNATVRLLASGRAIDSWRGDLTPEEPLLRTIKVGKQAKSNSMRLLLLAEDRHEIIAVAPLEPKKRPLPRPATEPAAPRKVTSADELYIIGVHLDQYRHATRSPVDYWTEALRRDPGDARCNNALGLWHMRRGEFSRAEECFRASIARLTERNPNPRDGEAYYNLGVALRYLHRDEEAYAAFYKAAWNQAWQSASYHSLAEIDCTRYAWETAFDHLDRSLRLNTENLRARDLRALVLRNLGREMEAREVLQSTLILDPLDWWARHILGQQISCDTQTRLDLALDYERAGFFQEAVNLLEAAAEEPSTGTAPLTGYYLGRLHARAGNKKKALVCVKQASRNAPDYCFPARLEEIEILETAIRLNPRDARAHYYLGNLLYDKLRHLDAINAWERSAKLDSKFSIVWRNLGIAYFNFSKKPEKARAAYERALGTNPRDARLFYERDQLWKRLRVSPERRLAELEKHREMAEERDDLSVELCALYNQTGQPEKALKIVSRRSFQPWEGGEGMALGQHVRTHVLLARAAEKSGDMASTRSRLEQALESPLNLGEAKHLLANQSDVHYYLGEIHAKLGDRKAAREHWRMAANFRGDFQQMSIRRFSDMTYYSALAMRRLGRPKEARKLFRDLLAYSRKLAKTKATIDYFATSLPTMLLFNEDIQMRQKIHALFMQAQASLGLGHRKKGRMLLKSVLRRDPSHAHAADLMAELSDTKGYL